MHHLAIDCINRMQSREQRRHKAAVPDRQNRGGEGEVKWTGVMRTDL